jgi:DNA-binding transcriptional MocR family regulator
MSKHSLIIPAVSTMEFVDTPHVLPTAALLEQLWLNTGKPKSKWCKPSTRALAEILKKSRRTIFRHLSILEEKGFIRRRHRAANGWTLSSLIVPGRRIARLLKYVFKRRSPAASPASQSSRPKYWRDQLIEQHMASNPPVTKEEAMVMLQAWRDSLRRR